MYIKIEKFKINIILYYVESERGVVLNDITLQ